MIAWPQAISEKAKNINKKDAHFRRYIATVDADAFLKNQIVWSEGHTTLDEAHATCDTAVVYNESLDLKSIVAAHALNGDKCLEFKNEELKEFGLDWKFELVKNYKIGTPVTDQADFATIENGMFTPKVFSTDGQASIGRTPIVRVSLLNGEKVVAVAYIKIFIKSPADVELPPFELKPVDKNGKNVFSFSCADGVSVLTTTVEDMNVKLYNGFYWCTEIRKVSKLPMIFVSSMNDNMNLVMAINMGGDDFITKPFDLNVLTVKIQAMLRRTYEFAGESHMLEHQGVWLNLSDGTLTYEEQILELSKNERKILQTLLENPGAIVTRENLMMALWESDVYVDENTLSVNVNRLRRKLETIGLADFILTRKGIGYQIKNGS